MENKTLTLRLAANEAKELETLKILTGNKTSSKTLIYLMKEFKEQANKLQKQRELITALKILYTQIDSYYLIKNELFDVENKIKTYVLKLNL